MKYINLTSHMVRLKGDEYDLGRGVWGSSFIATHVEQETVPACEQDDMPFHYALPSKVINLPEPRPDTRYIVSSAVAAACPNRNDLIVPGGYVRNEKGHIEACSYLIIPNAMVCSNKISDIGYNDVDSEKLSLIDDIIQHTISTPCCDIQEKYEQTICDMAMAIVAEDSSLYERHNLIDTFINITYDKDKELCMRFPDKRRITQRLNLLEINTDTSKKLIEICKEFKAYNEQLETCKTLLRKTLAGLDIDKLRKILPQ